MEKLTVLPEIEGVPITKLFAKISLPKKATIAISKHVFFIVTDYKKV